MHKDYKVENMTCGHCVATVKGALEALAGVRGVEVDLDAGRARIDGEIDDATVAATLTALGYPATPTT